MNKNNKTDAFNEEKVAKKSLPKRLRIIVKNIFFTIISVSIFFVGLEFILALMGIKPILLTEDPLVGFSKNIPLFVEKRQSDGTAILKTASNKRMAFNAQVFLKEKESGTYRIFSMGGSTTYGRPYLDKVSFSGWLRAYLKSADQKRKWEVINAGGISYASYRVVNLMNELKQYKPDMFIVYSGQNEFLEERSYGDLSDLPSQVLELNSLLSGTRTYAAVKKGIDALRPDTLEKARERYELTGEVDEILTHTAGPTTYHRDEKLKSQIITHYRLNLQLMVNIAREAGAKIVFVNPAINIKDMSPFKSEHKEGLDKKALDGWQDLCDRASALHKAGNLDEALGVYRQALSIDERYAELHYRIGQVLFESGRYDEAEKAFWRASDEDIAPLRILSSMQQVVEDVASKNDVPLIDFPHILKEAYKREYDHTIFGREYFVDHVHTTIEGYRLLGLALLDELTDQGIAKPGEGWNEERIEALRQEVLASMDKKAQSETVVNLAKVLSWAGKFDEAYNVVMQGLKRLGANYDIYIWLGAYLEAQGRHDESADYYSKAMALNQNQSSTSYHIGKNLLKQDNTDEAIKRYLETFRLNKDTKALEKAHLNIAYMFYQEKQYDKATKHLLEVLSSNPDHYAAHTYLGNVLKEQGRFEEAASRYNTALRLNPDFEMAKKNLETVTRRK